MYHAKPEDRKWWKSPASLLASRFVNEARRISYETNDRQNRILEGAALYGDVGGYRGLIGITEVVPTARRMAHNVLATAVDALVAEVTQSPPRPVAVTVGGTFTERRHARRLTSYWEAKFDECGVYSLGRQAVRDCINAGLGILRPFRENPDDPENDRVIVERIYPGNFLLDDSGCVDSYPRTGYIRRFVDRDHLISQYPEHTAAIEGATLDMSQMVFSRYTQSDVVEVYEGWRLASYEGADDGKYVVAIENAVLHEREYTRTKFPLAFVKPVPPIFGFWPTPLILRGAPAQKELNKLIRRIQESMHLHAVPRTFLQKQAGKSLVTHLQNDIGIVAYYEGEPPRFMVPQSMANDVYSYVMQLEQWIYRELGVSELSATSKKPPGLDSGTALRTYNDVQSRRWINLQRSYEDMHTELAREIAYLEQEIADEKSGPHPVGFNSRKYVKQIDWKDVYLDPQRYMTRVYSASALPNTPAGKLAALEEMVKMGVIDQRTFIMLADMPDFESVRDLEVAPRELLEEMFDEMLEKQKLIEPEVGMDTDLGIVLCILTLQRAKLDGASDDEVQVLRDWVYAAKTMETRLIEMEEQPGVAPPDAEGAEVTQLAKPGMQMLTDAPAMNAEPDLSSALDQPTMADVPAPYGVG